MISWPLARLLVLAVASTAVSSAPAADPGAQQPLALVRIEGRTGSDTPAALIAGRTEVLVLLSPPRAQGVPAVRLLQVAGALAAPLAGAAEASPDPDDPRLLRVSVRVPRVERATRLLLEVDGAAPLALEALPGLTKRDDLPPLADRIAEARLRVQLAGDCVPLARRLQREGIEFENLGGDPPDQVPGGVILLCVLPGGTWRETPPPKVSPGARLVVFTDDGTQLPCIRLKGNTTLVTLPLLDALAEDPRAGATLHALLLETLTSPAPAPSPQP